MDKSSNVDKFRQVDKPSHVEESSHVDLVLQEQSSLLTGKS
jgi:hypothetical protein